VEFFLSIGQIYLTLIILIKKNRKTFRSKQTNIHDAHTTENLFRSKVYQRQSPLSFIVPLVGDFGAHWRSNLGSPCYCSLIYVLPLSFFLYFILLFLILARIMKTFGMIAGKWCLTCLNTFGYFNRGTLSIKI